MQIGSSAPAEGAAVSFDDVLAGARNLVRYAGVRAEHQVLVLATDRCALGNFQYAGGRYYSKMQLPMFMWHPTIAIDDEPVVLDGELLLLRDPARRELASRYGDPDQLLTVRPLPKTLAVFG